MTKEELLLQNEDFKSQIEDLECEIDGLNEYISELENENFELSNNHKADYIQDFEAFKNRLFSDGIMTYELEVWLDDYMRWYNN